MLSLKHKNVKLAWRLSNYWNVSSWRNNLIKLTHFDESKKRAHDSQIVRAKENLKFSHGGPDTDKHQALTHWLKFYARAIIDSEAWPTIM